MEKISCIYQIQSKIKPERIYVGQTVNLHRRIIKHKTELNCNKHDSNKMQNHANKYGVDDLMFSVLEAVEPVLESLNQREQYYIDTLAYEDTKKPYFNTCEVAGSALGRKCSEATLVKMRQRTQSEEIRRKISLSHIGMTHTEASKIKIGLAGKGRVPWNKGKTGYLNEAALHKMSLAQLGKRRPDDVKQRIKDTCLAKGINKGREPYGKGKKAVYNIITHKLSYVDSTVLIPITIAV